MIRNIFFIIVVGAIIMFALQVFNSDSTGTGSGGLTDSVQTFISDKTDDMRQAIDYLSSQLPK